MEEKIETQDDFINKMVNIEIDMLSYLGSIIRHGNYISNMPFERVDTSFSGLWKTFREKKMEQKVTSHYKWYFSDYAE